MDKAKLIVVTGRPGSGKTTLTGRLADAMGCPVVSRDAIKAGLATTAGCGHAELPPETNAIVNALFVEVIGVLLRGGVSVIAEAAFQHRVWTTLLEPFLATADVRVIVCETDAETVRQRLERRATEQPDHAHFHGTATPDAPYDPPHLGVPTCHIDTGRAARDALADARAFADASLSDRGEQIIAALLNGTIYEWAVAHGFIAAGDPFHPSMLRPRVTQRDVRDYLHRYSVPGIDVDAGRYQGTSDGPRWRRIDGVYAYGWSERGIFMDEGTARDADAFREKWIAFLAASLSLPPE